MKQGKFPKQFWGQASHPLEALGLLGRSKRRVLLRLGDLLNHNPNKIFSSEPHDSPYVTAVTILIRPLLVLEPNIKFIRRIIQALDTNGIRGLR